MIARSVRILTKQGVYSDASIDRHCENVQKNATISIILPGFIPRLKFERLRMLPKTVGMSENLEVANSNVVGMICSPSLIEIGLRYLPKYDGGSERPPAFHPVLTALQPASAACRDRRRVKEQKVRSNYGRHLRRGLCQVWFYKKSK